jgi:hypothetical protein
MPVPIVCVDARLRQFLAAFRPLFSKPQDMYFETVVFGLLLCAETRTLSGLLRQVAERRSLAGVSRFLARAPWVEEDVAATWRARFEETVRPQVAAAHRQQRAARPPLRGRPPATVVTGYLIGDDSTQHKPRGQKMAGVGLHHSTTAGTRVRGHSLVQSLYVVEGRRCPLLPQMYRQQAVCTAAGVPFQSKVDLMEQTIRTFVPTPGPRTHVLLDTWYSAKRIWKAARQRDFLITTGLKNNRCLRVADPETARGWRWQTLREYAAGLAPEDYQPVRWPTQEQESRTVYVHVVCTRVRKLYRCQVVIVRESLTAPLSETRYWASSDLAADVPTLIGHVASRWQIEVLFADAKEVLGLDQYQVMSVPAIVRFWTLVLATYTFLEDERATLVAQQGSHVTIGETRRVVQGRHHRHLLTWIYAQYQAGATAEELATRLAA